MYGQPSHVKRAGWFGITENRLGSWLQSLERLAPEAAAKLWSRWGEGGVFGEALQACREHLPGTPHEWRDLLFVLLEARNPRPNDRWLARFAVTPERFPPDALQAALLELGHLGAEWEQQIAAGRGWVAPAGNPGMTIATGAIWALSDFRDEDTRDLLQRPVIAWSRSAVVTPALGLAAVWSLAQPADEGAIQRLLELRSPDAALADR